MKTKTHRGDHTEIAATSSQGPEEVTVLVRVSGNEPPIGENKLGADQVSKAKPNLVVSGP